MTDANAVIEDIKMQINSELGLDLEGEQVELDSLPKEEQQMLLQKYGLMPIKFTPTEKQIILKG